MSASHMEAKETQEARTKRENLRWKVNANVRAMCKCSEPGARLRFVNKTQARHWSVVWGKWKKTCKESAF